MKVLWLTNVPLPEASVLLGEKPSVYGGWLVNASKYLANEAHVSLNVVFTKSSVDCVQTLQGERITFFAAPAVLQSDSQAIENNVHFKQIIDTTAPDIVHIFGTEYAHTLAMINVCNQKNIRTVVSIQGFVSECAKHYMEGLPERVHKRQTFRDFIRQDNLVQQQRKFTKRGEYEIEAIQKTRHVIGRTTWDKACASQINPAIQYHFCNETLRDAFYERAWRLDGCKRHTIFASQGAYPIKGLHYLLEAMPLIRKKYADARLYIAGDDITSTKSIKDRLRLSSYGKYLRELIEKYHLEDSVMFAGILNEEEMCKRYLRSNVFVCPSSIENSPNSLGEAMILGVPSVASDVGGVTDMLRHKEEGFVYQTDASYMLAHYVCEIFSDDRLANRISKKAREHAQQTHDRQVNTAQMLRIYRGILGKVKK